MSDFERPETAPVELKVNLAAVVTTGGKLRWLFDGQPSLTIRTTDPDYHNFMAYEQRCAAQVSMSVFEEKPEMTFEFPFGEWEIRELTIFLNNVMATAQIPYLVAHGIMSAEWAKSILEAEHPDGT